MTAGSNTKSLWVKQSGDNYHRCGWPSLAENSAVGHADRIGVGGGGEENPGADDVTGRGAGLGERNGDDL